MFLICDCVAKVKWFPICDYVTNTSTIRGVQSLSKKNIGNMLKIFLSMILLILQFVKLLFNTSDTVDFKLLNPWPEDPKTNIEAPREVRRLTENSIFFIYICRLKIINWKPWPLDQYSAPKWVQSIDIQDIRLVSWCILHECRSWCRKTWHL